MLRDLGLRHREVVHDRPDSLLACEQRVQDLAAARLADRVEGVRRRGRARHGVILCRYRHMSIAPAIYRSASTTFLTTHRCFPSLRSRVNPSCSYVESAPLKRKPAGTASAPSGYPSTMPPPTRAIRSSAPANPALV